MEFNERDQKKTKQETQKTSDAGSQYRCGRVGSGIQPLSIHTNIHLLWLFDGSVQGQKDDVGKNCEHYKVVEVLKEFKKQTKQLIQ